jgi:hypothetical protein
LEKKRAILLTGTIVANSIHTAHSDAEKRLSEYLAAIRFYANLFPKDTVYFLENSTYELENSAAYLKEKQQTKFEVLRFVPSNNFYEGKGYQEFKMLDEAILQLSSYDSFIKITGRYIIRNAETLTRFDCKSLIIDCSKKRKLADTYFIYFTRSFYLGYFLNAYKNANDAESRFIEHVIFNRLIASNRARLFVFFKTTPLLEGITGSYGLPLKQNPLKVLLKNMLRFYCRLTGQFFLNF